MRDDLPFGPEEGATTPVDRSDDAPSSDLTYGRDGAPTRPTSRIGERCSHSRFALLRGSGRPGCCASSPRRFTRRPSRAVVAGVALCALGVAAFAETRAASLDVGDEVATGVEMRQRADGELPATRSDDRSAPPAADAAALPPDQKQTPEPAPSEPAPAEPTLPPGHLESGPVAGLSVVQMNNAKAVVWTGVDMGMPRRALVIAVATAMQESNLLNRASEVLPESKNYPHQGTGWDHDSVGLFQQRTSTGWGPVHKIMDPAYASQQFYRALMRVPGWQDMPLTLAAQAVQVSAFPFHYAKHEARATEVVNALTDVP